MLTYRSFISSLIAHQMIFTPQNSFHYALLSYPTNNFNMNYSFSAISKGINTGEDSKEIFEIGTEANDIVKYLDNDHFVFIFCDL